MLEAVEFVRMGKTGNAHRAIKGGLRVKLFVGQALDRDSDLISLAIHDVVALQMLEAIEHQLLVGFFGLVAKAPIDAAPHFFAAGFIAAVTPKFRMLILRQSVSMIAADGMSYETRMQGLPGFN